MAMKKVVVVVIKMTRVVIAIWWWGDDVVDCGALIHMSLLKLALLFSMTDEDVRIPRV